MHFLQSTQAYLQPTMNTENDHCEQSLSMSALLQIRQPYRHNLPSIQNLSYFLSRGGPASANSHELRSASWIHSEI